VGVPAVTDSWPGQPLGLADYVAVVRRRGGQIALLAAVLFAAAGTGVMMLPAVYESRATILIEQQEIPRDLVRSTVTTYADQRLQVIHQRVMTTENLLGIIRELDLYPELRRSEPVEAVLAAMQSDVSMETVSARVIDPRTGKPTEATIAFSVAYTSDAPARAQRVANALTTLYLDENLRSRTQLTVETSAFLAEETRKAGAALRELEERIAQFKQRHADSLPELSQLNLQLMDRTERELADLEQRRNALEERRIYLESEQAQREALPGERARASADALDPRDRLRALQTQYLSLSSAYSESHPDVVRVRKEMRALRTQVGVSPDLSALEAELDAARLELAALAERYAAGHPDVKRATRRVDVLERELDTVLLEEPAAAVEDDVALVQLRTQLAATRFELQSLREREAELRGKLDRYEARLTAAPQVERAYRELLREHENAARKFRELGAKETEARLAQSLESDRKGERFTLLEPPTLPQQPVRPNRVALLALALLLAVAGGFASAAFAEAVDGTVHGRRGLERMLPVPVLAAIPHIVTPREARLRRVRVAAGAAGVVLLAAGAAAAVHVWVVPLETAWAILAQRLERSV